MPPVNIGDSLHKLPVQSSSILANCALRQSLTHKSMSCRDKFSDVTFVEYTFTAIVALLILLFLAYTPLLIGYLKMEKRTKDIRNFKGIKHQYQANWQCIFI